LEKLLIFFHKLGFSRQTDAGMNPLILKNCFTLREFFGFITFPAPEEGIKYPKLERLICWKLPDGVRELCPVLKQEVVCRRDMYFAEDHLNDEDDM
jgi:hypothetical protein